MITYEELHATAEALKGFADAIEVEILAGARPEAELEAMRAYTANLRQQAAKFMSLAVRGYGVTVH